MTWQKSSGISYETFLANLDRSGHIVTTATVMERDERGNPIKITVSVTGKNQATIYR